MRRTCMRSRLALAAALVLALSALPRTVHAYGVNGVGGILGYSNPEDPDGTASVSVHAELERRGTRVHLVPNMLCWNVNGVRDLAPSMNVYYRLRPAGDSEVGGRVRRTDDNRIGFVRPDAYQAAPGAMPPEVWKRRRDEPMRQPAQRTHDERGQRPGLARAVLRRRESRRSSPPG
jgi:hypothetical protein